MTVNRKTSSDYMSIRAWLRLAAIGLVAIAGMLSVVVYKIAMDVQIHAEHLRQTARLQAINAELGRDVTRAWLNVNSGNPAIAAPALAELRQHGDKIRDIMDSFHTRDETYPPIPLRHDPASWVQLLKSMTELINIADAIVARNRSTTAAATPVTPAAPSLDHAALKAFMHYNRATIASLRFVGSESYANVRWVLQNLRTMTLAIFAAITLYGLLFFLFVCARIEARTADVSSRILRYTSGLPDPPETAPRRDEFGTIEARVDECAQSVYNQQMAVAREHEETLQELKARTDEMVKLNATLRNSGRALVRFLTDVSHDLRTPLAIMVGESEVSLRSQSTSPEEYKETLSRMLDQTRYLGSLVDQLLFTARSRVSVEPLQPENVDVPKLVAIACRDMRTLAANRQMTIKLTDTSKRKIVHGDQTRLREMLLTIIDNAVEYSRPNTTITVSISEQDEHLKIAISDNGIGIPSHEIPMIFRRFYRAKNAPDATAQGTGIGLAVAKGIIESHDGTIDIDSQENRGTTVTLMLPLVDDQGPGQSQPERPPQANTEQTGAAI